MNLATRSRSEFEKQRRDRLAPKKPAVSFLLRLTCALILLLFAALPIIFRPQHINFGLQSGEFALTLLTGVLVSLVTLVVALPAPEDLLKASHQVSRLTSITLFLSLAAISVVSYLQARTLFYIIIGTFLMILISLTGQIYSRFRQKKPPHKAGESIWDPMTFALLVLLPLSSLATTGPTEHEGFRVAGIRTIFLLLALQLVQTGFLLLHRQLLKRQAQQENNPLCDRVPEPYNTMPLPEDFCGSPPAAEPDHKDAT